jgi:Domain of unknown function (DUF4136)
MSRAKLITLCMLTALVAACTTGPEIHTRVAEQVNLASFHTYGFAPKLGTDAGPYKSLTTQQLERDVGQELQSRGFTPATAGQSPDLLVNFAAQAHDRVEGLLGPGYGMGMGWGGAGWVPGPWGPWGWGGGPWGWGAGPWAWGGYYSDVRTITTTSLTVDLIDRSSKSVVWSGTALSELTRRMMDHPAQSIDEAVHQIFLHFPIARH